MLFKSTFCLIATFAVASAAVIGVRDVATLKADIASITTAVNKLDADITAFPDSGGTVAGALVSFLWIPPLFHFAHLYA